MLLVVMECMEGNIRLISIDVNLVSAGCGVYSTWKHVPASPKAKPQVGAIEKL